MMMLTPTISILGMLLVVQMIMIFQSEVVIKYIVSMRYHGSGRAPVGYEGPTTPTTTASAATEIYFQSHTNDLDNDNDDDDDDHSNKSATKIATWITGSKDHHNCNTECSRYDSSFCPRFPEP